MKVLLDASALLCYLLQEAGWETVEHALYQGASISAVNLSEVTLKLKRDNVLEKEIEAIIQSVPLEVVPCDNSVSSELLSQAFQVPSTVVLSLADRICLATAAVTKLPVITADRIWMDLPLSLERHCLR